MSVKFTKLHVQLNFDVTIANAPEQAALVDIEKALNNDGYSDGRKDFCLEMIEHALGQRIHGSVTAAVDIHHRRLYGNEMVRRPQGDGATARACIESDRVMRDVTVVNVAMLDEGAKVKVTAERELR